MIATSSKTSWKPVIIESNLYKKRVEVGLGITPVQEHSNWGCPKPEYQLEARAHPHQT